MSQFTPQELEEFEFRERAEKEFAAKQTPDARDTEAAVSNVVYPAVGAAVGAAAGSLPTKIVNGMVQDPVTGKWMAVENYARQMAQGKYYGGQNYNQVWDKIREYNADPTQGPRLEKEAMANRSTGQKMLANTPKPLQGLVSKPMGVIGRGTVGLGAGLQGSDALNRYKAGDTSGAVISGLGALGTAAAMIPHPVTRIGGTAIGLGAEGLNTFLDYLKKKSQKPAQAQPQQPQQMAEGGSAKKKMSKAERAAKAIRENNKKKVPHLADGGVVGSANFVPGNGPPPGMTWSETQGQWMPSNSVVGAMPGFAPGTDPINNFDTSGNSTQNSNPYGFTAPSGPSLTVMSPYYNTKTGESWSAPSSGWTAPSSDWIQGALEGKFMPMPGPNAPTLSGPLGGVGQPPVGGLNPFANINPNDPMLEIMGGDKSKFNNGSRPPSASIGDALGSLNNLTTNAPKPVASITPQQPFQQRRVAPPLSGNINPSFAKRPLPYTPKPIPKPMPRRRMFAEGGSTTPAWQRSEGKNPEGGLNAVGRASYNRQTGGELKPPVSADAAKSSPKKAARRKSFCARMSGNPGPMKDEKGRPTRKALALRKWDC